VRLTRIDNLDLSLFEFDYDLTFMVFFLDADTRVYARYGGRDASSPDSRQSLAGLKYTMQSVLKMHEQNDRAFAPKKDTPKFIREVAGGKGGRCMHCHQVKEVLNADLKKKGQWTADLAWRYPLPENLGIKLEVDRGNVVKEVQDNTPASAAGLKPGDVLQRLNGVPIHSFADAQFALDRAVKTEAVEVAWSRGDTVLKDKLALPEGWRKTAVTWRPSLRHLLPFVRLSGNDLTAEEKKQLGLPAKQLAYRPKEPLSSQAKTAGIQPGDVILGVDGKMLELDSVQFVRYLERNYLVGEQLTINVLRDGKRVNLPMTLKNN
jgi:predicted metalloprotease with PDZ domain